jgi:hypothetical protein
VAEKFDAHIIEVKKFAYDKGDRLPVDKGDRLPVEKDDWERRNTGGSSARAMRIPVAVSCPKSPEREGGRSKLRKGTCSYSLTISDKTF